MNTEDLDIDDYYALATYYRKRISIIVNDEGPRNRDLATHLTISNYRECLKRLPITGESASYRSTSINIKHISCMYYLAELIQNYTGSETVEKDLWDRTVTLHQSIRYYIDFIWTLCLYQIPQLDDHLYLVTLALPHGFTWRFDLSKLVESSRSLRTKMAVASVYEDIRKREAQKRVPLFSAPSSELGELDQTDDSLELRHLQLLAGLSIKGIFDCLEELSLYLNSAKGDPNLLDSDDGYIQCTEVPCPEFKSSENIMDSVLQDPDIEVE